MESETLLKTEGNEANSITKAKKRRSPVFRYAAIAAILVLLICLFLAAKVWQKESSNPIIQRAIQSFCFMVGNGQGAGDPNAENIQQYQSLQEAMAQTNTPSDIVPSQLPEGFVFDNVKVTVSPVKRSYVALYTKDGRCITITVHTYLDSDPQRIEANESILETITTENNTYYIFSNNAAISAIWQKDSCECCITGDLTIDDVKQMINSIPER